MKTWMVLATFAACNLYHNNVRPEEAALAFSRQLGIELKGSPVCAAFDTDNDGYVTCTLNVRDSREAAHLESLQCAVYGGIEVSGCKGTIAKAAPTTNVTVIR